MTRSPLENLQHLIALVGAGAALFALLWVLDRVIAGLVTGGVW